MLTVAMIATPSPSPSLNVNEDSITPGIVGFLAILLVAAGTLALGLDMVRRIRRVRYRGELADRKRQADRSAPPRG